MVGKGTLASIAAAFLTLLAVGAATAAQPQREPLLFEDFTIEGVCGFPVLFEATANKEYITFFEDGRVQVNGKFKVVLTNTLTGTSLGLNASGPALLAPVERYRGRSIVLLFSFDAGGPGMVLTTGRVDILRAEDGSIVGMETHGSTVDVCAALA
jgi:hypothetical protein